jgi:hypothetical protein
LTYAQHARASLKARLRAFTPAPGRVATKMAGLASCLKLSPACARSPCALPISFPANPLPFLLPDRSVFRPHLLYHNILMPRKIMYGVLRAHNFRHMMLGDTASCCGRLTRESGWLIAVKSPSSLVIGIMQGRHEDLGMVIWAVEVQSSWHIRCFGADSAPEVQRTEIAPPSCPTPVDDFRTALEAPRSPGLLHSRL